MTTAELEYVGFWPRFGAFVIDSILVLLVIAPLLSFFFGSSGDDVDLEQLLSSDLTGLMAYLIRPASAVDVLINWVLPAVAVIVLWLTRGATPGKMVFGARVVDAATGGPLSPLQSIVRYLGYYVSTIPFFMGLIWVAFDPRKQGWHDKLAKTVVVRSRNRGPQPVKFGGG